MPKLPPKRAHEDGGVADMQLAFDAVADDTLLPPEPDAKDAAKKKPKAKAKNRKERKGFQWCPGCDQSKPADSFSLNQRFDMECKRLLDRIYHQCKAQGELDWFNQQRAQDNLVKKVLDHYRSLQAKTGEGQKTSKFMVAIYKARSSERTDHRHLEADAGRQEVRA